MKAPISKKALWARSYRASPEGKLATSLAVKKYQRQNPEKMKMIWERYHLRNIEKYKMAQKQYRKRYESNPANRHKISARRRISYLLKIGKLTKAPCEECGAVKVHAHHPDYMRKEEILWLCPVHHKDRHRLAEVIHNF